MTTAIIVLAFPIVFGLLIIAIFNAKSNKQKQNLKQGEKKMSKTIIEIDENLSAVDKKRLGDIIDAYTSTYSTIYSRDEYIEEIYPEMEELVIKNLREDAESQSY